MMLPTPLRLLLAEDSEDDATLLVRSLEAAEFTVAFERVDSGEALRDALASGRQWDIVISDYSMPGFTGIDALEIVRSRDPDLPFIFVSGTIGEEVAVRAMRAGAQDYVMKGDLRRLAPAVHREMREAFQRRERRRTEERLRTTTQVLHAVFNASPLGIVVTGVDGRVQFWNPALERMLGWSEREVVGQPIPSIPDGERDTAVELTAHRTDAVPGGARDARRRHKDGSFVDVHVDAAVTRDDVGQPNRIISIVQDIRERKRLEAQFLQAQKMEAVGRLAGGIAHDFNNLLTVITSYSEFLLESLDSTDPRHEDVTQIRAAAAAATSLSRQLLVFSRSEVLQPQVVAINDVVSGAAKMLTRVIGADVELLLALDPSAGLIEVDPGQLEQVIMNLTINARDAMPSGGKLVVETRNASINGPVVTLSVSDTGVGMDAETQAHMFEPFFTTKEAGKGTGLGLSTVYTIVQQAGGGLTVYSEPGVGTMIRAHFPRADVGPVVDAPAISPEAVRGVEVVLVVEDAPAVRSVTRQVLERFGYTVLEAPDGPTALQLAAKHQGDIHLLLTDVVMPGMSARELASQFCARRANTRVLYTSGYTPDAIRHHGVLDEGVAYLQKPFTPEALALSVRDTLDRDR